MAEFEKNARVVFQLNGKQQRGRVTRVLPKWRRIVTDSGKRLRVSVRRLRSSPDRVLILETRLDRGLRSERAYGPMMQRWLSAYNVVALYERVHTVEGMRRFLRREGKNIATRFIHIMGHGVDEAGHGTATLRLTFDTLDLTKQADVFAGLDEKIIIFSCCELGGDLPALRAVKKASGAATVIAYRVGVEDWYTNLTEALIYDRLLWTNRPPHKVVRQVINLLERENIRLHLKITRKPVLVCV